MDAGLDTRITDILHLPWPDDREINGATLYFGCKCSAPFLLECAFNFYTAPLWNISCASCMQYVMVTKW